MAACELSKKHFLESSFIHVWFIYLLKIKAILQLSLHMTPNADIFCIIVPHWSHGRKLLEILDNIQAGI